MPQKEKVTEKARPFKRVGFFSDPHCGHRVGLTHPDHQSGNCGINGMKYFYLQNETWKLFDSAIEPLRPFDIAVFPGDLVDGDGKRSGGTEQISTDMNVQCLIAEKLIKFIDAPTVVIVRGTPYHVSPNGQDYEDQIAKAVNATKIGDHEWLDVNGLIFDVKHKVGGSSVPYGKGTPIAKEQLWNMIWADHEEQPRSDIIIRGHVHYHYIVGQPPKWLGMTLPALQAMGSKYGARQCSGHVDWGFVYFDVFTDGSYTWESMVIPVKSQKATALKL